MRMERDFMGLGSKEPIAVVKEEITDASVDSVPGVTWPFMRMGSTLPHSTQIKAEQDDTTKIMTSVPTSSPGFAPINSAGEIQNTSFCKQNFAASGWNSAGIDLKQRFLAGLPQAVPSPASPVVGVTEPGYGFKASTACGQMTIFYAGSVTVYDDISPEKAQAIMLLAGNGSPSIPLNQRSLIQAPSSKLTDARDVIENHPINSLPCTGLSSPRNLVRSCSLLSSTDDVVTNKNPGLLTASVAKPELRPTMSSLSAISLATIIPSGIPQARKASLARFLEKRKERMMSVAPYSCEEKPPQESADAGKDEAGISATSSTDGGSPSAGKED